MDSQPFRKDHFIVSHCVLGGDANFFSSFALFANAFRSFLLIFGDAATVTSSISSSTRGSSDKSDSLPARKSESFQISRNLVVTADIIRPLGQPASIRSWPLTGNLGGSHASIVL